MLRSKQYIAVMLGCLLAGCSGQHKFFDASKSINASFLKEIPASVQQVEKTVIPPVFSMVEVYKTTFSQQYAEAENVLVEALLHDSGTIKPVKYVAPIYGFRQDLYLLKLKAANGNTYFIYFSAWYDDSYDPPRQTGFGPAYWGKLNSMQHTITFIQELAMKELAEGLYLKPLRRSRKFFFVLNPLPENQIGIQRIVLTERNKIGADRMYVFPVRHTKLDKLIFTRSATLQL